MASPNTPRLPAAAQAPARVRPEVWEEAILGLDLEQIGDLRRKAGLLFLQGVEAEEAVLEARSNIILKSETLRVMASVLIGGHGHPTPQHVLDAAEAVKNTINAIGVLPEACHTDVRDLAMDQAWRDRRWHVSGDTCSACGRPFEAGKAPLSKMGPIYHPQCQSKAARRIGLAFARLVVARVQARGRSD